MAGNDPVDQDAIAAQWEASLDSEDPAEAAEAAAANEISGTMALQWAAMVEDGSRDFGGGKNGGERVLSQEEIDNLLGFSVGEVNLDDNSGIRAIIDSAMVSYERLPMLEIVFDRLVRLMTTSLRNFTSDNVEVSLDRITSVRFGDYMNSIPLPAVLSVFKAEEWDNFRAGHGGLQPDLFDDRRAARRPSRPDLAADRRPALHHDRNQSGEAAGRGGAGRRRAGVPAAVAGDIHASTGWKPIRALPRSAGPPTPPFWCGCASTWRIAAATSNCCCPMRPSSRSAAYCCRCSWAKNSAAIRSGKVISRPRVAQAQISVDAVLYEADIPLKQLMKLKVGDTLPLEMRADALVAVRCGSVTLTEGRMGRVGDRVAIRVTKPLRKPNTTFAMFEKADEQTKLMEAQ